MENSCSDDRKLLFNAECKAQIHQEVQCTRLIPNKDIEFKVMMLEDELQKEQSKTLETDDSWSMYDGQYPRLGPMIFTKCEDTADEMTSMDRA